MFSVSVWTASLVVVAATGSGASSSVGSLTPGSIVRSSIWPPSITSGPAIGFVTCGEDGKAWTGWPPPPITAPGTTLTVIVATRFQSATPKVMYAGAPPAAAWKRASLEETKVLPSVRIETVTDAVGQLRQDERVGVGVGGVDERRAGGLRDDHAAGVVVADVDVELVQPGDRAVETAARADGVRDRREELVLDHAVVERCHGDVERRPVQRPEADDVADQASGLRAVGRAQDELRGVVAERHVDGLAGRRGAGERDVVAVGGAVLDDLGAGAGRGEHDAGLVVVVDRDLDVRDGRAVERRGARHRIDDLERARDDHGARAFLCGVVDRLDVDRVHGVPARAVEGEDEGVEPRAAVGRDEQRARGGAVAGGRERGRDRQVGGRARGIRAGGQLHGVGVDVAAALVQDGAAGALGHDHLAGAAVRDVQLDAVGEDAVVAGSALEDDVVDRSRWRPRPEAR